MGGGGGASWQRGTDASWKCNDCAWGLGSPLRDRWDIGLQATRWSRKNSAQQWSVSALNTFFIPNVKTFNICEKTSIIFLYFWLPWSVVLIFSCPTYVHLHCQHFYSNQCFCSFVVCCCLLMLDFISWSYWISTGLVIEYLRTTCYNLMIVHICLHLLLWRIINFTVNDKKYRILILPAL